MSCNNCKSINTPIDELCNDCLCDSSLVISVSEIKRIYKLTDANIENAKLIKSSHKYHGVKYLRKDIEELVQTVMKDLSDDNKQKISYLRQTSKVLHSGKNKKIVADRTKFIMEYLVDIATKYDTIDITKERRICNAIARFAKTTDITAINLIIPIIEETIQKHNRRSKIYTMIDLQIDPKYTHRAKASPECNEYIKSGLFLDLTFANIKNNIEIDMQRDDRIKNILIEVE
jgi:hypothetical protein